MAAAPSITAGKASSAGYVWEDPGDSIMIQVSLDLIEGLGAAVQQGLGTGPRGNEIGGILLGRPLPGFRRAILVEDFELAPCEHLRGASYTLSPKDQRLLGARLAGHPGRRVVGYFRSHTRPGMYLDQDDFAIFSNYFPEPWQVFLLVRPSMEGPAMGGFFFWEEGDVNRRSTYRQFPFDRVRLAGGDFPITGDQPAAAPVPLPSPVLVPKPEVRARRRAPALHWVVVPVIAVLFLIAGLFVSENRPPAREVPAEKASVPVEPLLPEPVPHAAARVPVPPPEAEPVAQAPPERPKTVATLTNRTTKPSPKLIAPPPLTVARVPSRVVEPPPALTLPIAKLDPSLPAVLSHVGAAPPPAAEVTYEAPRPGVFRRALHKIEGTGDGESAAFVPASPIRQVAPERPADAGAEARPVDIKVFIDEAGNVSRAQVLTKGSYLASAALAAARQWRFTPARKHDKPVASEMVLHFR